jgi:hypothetical protein
MARIPRTTFLSAADFQADVRKCMRRELFDYTHPFEEQPIVKVANTVAAVAPPPWIC